MKELEKIVDSNGVPMEIVDAEARADISEIKQSLVNKSKNVQGSINAYWNGLSVTIDFSGAIRTQAPTGANTDIATLPSEVPKPSTTKYVVASGGANQNKYLVVGIFSDGKIKVFNYTGGVVDYLYGSITYLR